ncbi:LPS-assembly protein LptD [Bartonella sp. B10]
MTSLMSGRIILTKIKSLILKSVIISIFGVFLSFYIFEKNLHAIAKNSVQDLIPPLFLSADELIYNRDSDTISAQGNVQIKYNGNKVFAPKVTYNQKTRRIIAQGNVKIIQKNGNKIYSNQIDITQDFGEGFISSLRIDTVDNVHFSAKNAIRSNNQTITFNNAAYTACGFCFYRPDKEVLWKIKARKIIWNNTIKTIRFENSRFEFFGIPIIQLSTFELDDPSVHRANGFLSPHFFYDNKLGIGIKNSYFWNLAPYYDLTLSSTVYTQQGFLTEGEWRQRFKTGNYNIRFAHINQIKPHHFDNDTIDAQHTNRYMLETKGDFRVNSRWTYGWDILAQSDRNFSHTYKLKNYDDPTNISQIYVNGLAGKNKFDMHLYHFNVLNFILNDNYHKHPSQQTWILPYIDYSFIPNKPIYSGMLTFHSNMQSIYHRHNDSNFSYRNSHPIEESHISSITENISRLTNELEWKKHFKAYSGFILTSILALRADVIKKSTHQAHIFNMENSTSSAVRGIATFGLEVRYPLLITSNNSTHIVEPTAQIFIRNNERYIKHIQNKYTQNVLFDATSLFQRNKFYGYDRVEGGTRANIGIRYFGNLNNNWSLYGLIGQSFHLAGKNSFTKKDFINVDADSGLETRRSDYVAMFHANHKSDFSFKARGRFDKNTGTIHRSEIEASQKWKKFSVSLQYAYIPNQLNYGYRQDHKEISFQTSVKLANYWSIDSSIDYDLVSDTFIKQGIDLNYTNECFSLKFGYQRAIISEKKTPLQSFNFSLSLRTITDIGKK